MNFDEFDFDSRIVAGIKKQGFVTPTPIQEQAIPPVLAGGDLLGIAQTGTGKTAAFVLPILERLVASKERGVRALIVAPTRELALQIDDVIRSLARRTKLRSAVLIGGVRIGSQIGQLERGANIVVACPGRLLDHVERRTISLSKVEMFTLDEADQLFDMGFLPAIRRICKKLPRERQNLLFTATMPEDIRKLADDILVSPTVIEVDAKTPPPAIEHALYPVSAHQKPLLLLRLLEQMKSESVLVFTRTKHRAKSLTEKLGKAGYSATCLQGNLSQGRRKEAMSGFKSGKYKVLVATDIAARGIDISTISHVINYDVPSTPELYMHRIGRTGRARRSGDAYTLVIPEEGRTVAAIERHLEQTLERRTLDDFDYKQDYLPAVTPKGGSGKSANRRGGNGPKNRFQKKRRGQRRGPGKRGESGGFTPRRGRSAERSRPSA